MSSLGVTPPDAIVIVYGLEGPEGFVGGLDPPPHDARRRHRNTTRIAIDLIIRTAGLDSNPRWPRLLDDDLPLQAAAFKVVVVVIAAGAAVGKAKCRFRLAWLQQTDIRQ